MQKQLENTLNLAPNLNVKSDRTDPAIATAIELIQDNLAEKNIRDSKNQLIQDLFESGFVVKEPKGTRKIGSKMLQQAIWRTTSRMKPLDFIIHGTGRPEMVEKLVTDAVATVLDRGGYINSLRDKGGAFQKLLMYGDGFIHVGTEDKGMPIKFNPIDNSNIYTDTYTTAVRGGYGRECRQMVVMFSYSWDEVVEMFPEMKNKAGVGKIPRDVGLFKEQDRTFNQDTVHDTLTEVAYFYDLNSLNYTVFIGSETTIQKQLTGDDYPFIKDGEPYIPVLQYICQPSSAGFFNHGIGDMLFDLSIISRQLFNMGVGHAEDNVYPITHINVPKGEASKYFNKLSLAHEMRAAGKKGFVAMEYDPTNPNGARVSSESLTTNSLVNEWQLIFDNIVRELQRLGINLDEGDRGGNVTATQILAEEESSNAFVKQVMEWNASESQFAIELTLDMISKFISKKDKTQLNLTTILEGANGSEVRADGITLGMISEELKTNNYFVRVNARSGVIPSNTYQQAQVVRMLNTTPPGTPAWNKLYIQLAKLNDRDINSADLAMAAEAAGGAVDEAAEAAPAQTERNRINARSDELEPAL